MTAPDHSVPDGAYTITSLSELQALDEAKIRQRMQKPAIDALAEIRESLADNLLAGIGQALEQGISGAVNTIGSWFQPVHDAASQVHDGQIELNDRQDLLDNLLNMGRTYCSAVQTYSANVWTKMPFDTQFGTLREAEIIPGGIKLKKKGQWNIWAQIYTVNMTAPFATRDVAWQVRVYLPAESGTGGWTLHSVTDGRYVGNSPGHDTIMTSVQFEQDEANVEVWVKTNLSGKTFGYGPSYNQLTVQQITSERQGADGSEDSGLPDDG